MSEVEELGLADLLLLAEDVLGVPAEQLARVINVGNAESALAAPSAGFEDYQRYVVQHEKVAVLGSRLIRNHPLPDGNKRVALLAMIERAHRAGLTWTDPPGGQDETAVVITALAARDLSEDEFVIWVGERVGVRRAA